MKVRTKSLFYSLIISFLLFQTCFTQLKYMDEIVTIISFAYLFITSIKQKKDNKFLEIIFLMGIMIILGLLGNFIYKIQTNKMAILLDIESMFKCFICFIAFYRLFERSKYEDKKSIIEYLTNICKITVFVGFVLAIINVFYDIGMYTDVSYGLRSFHFIFGRVGNLNNFCVRSLLIFTLALYLNNEETKNKKTNKSTIIIFIIMNLFLMISTLRTRAFASAILYFFGYLYFVKGKRIKIKLRYIIPIILVLLYIALPKINYFYNNTTRARNVLLTYGIQTAKNYYPIGAGFASYGTSSAQDYDSSLHKKYNFDSYYGLSTDDGFFLTDNYWPAIMGEVGFFGAIIMLIILIKIFKLIINETKNNNIKRFGSIFVFVTLLISSLVSSSFFNSMAISAMILISLALNMKEDIKRLN